ncbi:MAG: hypothetical protein O7F71_19565 [Gammaproteobacteria bacterium]|nr:hypothetical protein [Gammaproteobacteria bacterium]
MSYLLELNDTELPLYDGDELIHRSPAIAIVREPGMVFGEEALRLSRSHPQQTNQQYFSRLNGDPLPHPIAKAGNHADLVYLHLCELKPLIDGELILAVPGLWSPDQLGVLLGIMQEAGIVVGGFVDSAVVVATTEALPPEAYFVDIHLQRACVTALTMNDEVNRGNTEEVSTCGFTGLLDGWVNVIADTFVRSTRFDPLHSAATEQQLYDQVYDWLQGEPANEICVEILHEGHTHRAEVSRTLLADKARQRFRNLGDVLPEGAHVLLSSRSADLPGLADTLTDAGYTTSTCAVHALAEGCANHIELIRSPVRELKLVTRLPHLQESTVIERVAQAPTHILVGNNAVPIATNGLPLKLEHKKRQVLLRAQEGVTVNGQTVKDETVLNIGDEIMHGELSYRMIVVEG